MNEHKTELLFCMSSFISKIPCIPGKILIVTYHGDVLPDPLEDDVSLLKPGTHEAANTRMFLHVAHCIQSGYKSFHIIDTDVIVLLAASVAN